MTISIYERSGMGTFELVHEEEGVMWAVEQAKFLLWGDVDKGGDGKPE